MRNYPRWRHVWERVSELLAYSSWPARLAARVGSPFSVKVEHHEVLVAGSLGDASLLRIAFASDFHAGPTTPWPLIKAGIEALHRLQADVLLLGGDFVSLNPRQIHRLAPLLGAIPAPLGRFAVLGNHDHWAGAKEVVEALKAAGLEVLTNRHAQLPAPFQDVSVCGLDDHTSGEPDAAAAFAGSRPVRLLLMHAPSGVLDARGEEFQVAFCGHTHGGQIALPGGRPLLVGHGAFSRRYNAGRYALEEGRTLLVSRGVGHGIVPIRANSPSSILSCSLVAQAKPKP